MYDEIIVYASVCVLKNKMTCATKLDYSDEEVRNLNLTHSSSTNCAIRQNTCQDVWSLVWTQWMAVKSLVPCHAMHVPRHIAVSLSQPLNQRISSAQSLHIWTRHIQTHLF